MVPTPLKMAIGLAIIVVLASFELGGSADLCEVDAIDTSCGSGVSATSGSALSITAQTARGLLGVQSSLSSTFYDKSCPQYKTIIEQVVASKIRQNPLQAAGILRIMFHDCFVQGCDASLLLVGAGGSEQSSIPNQSVRRESLQMVNDIKAQLEKACPRTVSCADIISVAAAAAIKQTQGPSIQVLVGRRDGTRGASSGVILAHLPAPFMNVSQMLPDFASLGLDFNDMVALSGGHTLGLARCSSFSNRLRPNVDVHMDANLAKQLLQLCPSDNSNSFRSLDSTPTVFDNLYFKQLLAGDVLLTSDTALLQDGRTSSLVKTFASNRQLFNAQFVRSFFKLSQVGVLTGNAGTIRTICSSN